MEISQETKLKINNYMIIHFKNKSNVGYQYIKRMLECVLEEYKKTGYLDNPKLSILKQKARIEVSYGACQRAVQYFLQAEGLPSNFAGFVVNVIEDIIETDSQNIIEEDDF